MVQTGPTSQDYGLDSGLAPCESRQFKAESRFQETGKWLVAVLVAVRGGAGGGGDESSPSCPFSSRTSFLKCLEMNLVLPSSFFPVLHRGKSSHVGPILNKVYI